MIQQIVSGGQTGADRGALEAAKMLGVKTGGMAAKDYMTDVGPDLTLVEFGLMDVGMTYAQRTEYNVASSDGTLLIAHVDVHRNMSSGSALTLRQIKAQNKPYWTIDYPGVDPSVEVAQDLARWIRRKVIKVLNVAGNRESVAKGIQDYVFALVMLLLSVKDEEI